VPRALIAIAIVAASTGAARAQDKPGTVTVVESKEIWKADGMTVRHAQFTPDGERIVFVAKGKDGLVLASVKPDGSGAVKLHTSKELDVRLTAMWVGKDRLNATFKVKKATREVYVGLTGGDAKVHTYADGEVVAQEPVGGWPEEKCAASSADHPLVASTKDLASPVGIVRGAGLWVRRTNVKTTKQWQILDPKAWLVGVAYYKHMIAWAPPKASSSEPGQKESRRIRFVGARIKPFPGLKHRPLCVWEVTINDKLERVGEPKRLGTFGWWPRYFRGDPALHGCTGWNVGIGHGQYMADFSTGKVYKFDKQAFGRGTRATYNPGCTLAALPGKTLKVLTLRKTD